MKKKIKVGVDVRDLKISKSGARTYLEELCKEFRKEDPDFEFIFINTILPVYTGKYKIYKLIEQFRFLLWKQCQLPIIAIIKKCDIVFCSDYFVPYLHPGFVNIPVFHDAFFWEYPSHYNKYWSYLFHFLGVGAAKKSPFIITPTKYTQQQIAHFSGIDKEKIIPIYEAAKRLNVPTLISQSAFENLEKSLSYQYILHVGTFEKRKNLLLLLEAFDSLTKQGHSNLKLILIGQSSPKKNIDDSTQLFQMIKANNLEEKVIIPGYVSDEILHFYYKNAALYVFPSRNEGFGIPVLEAFGYGIPVIIANNSCLPEITGDAAISFHPDDKEDLCLKMKELLTNTSLRKQLSEKGYERVKYFSWEKAAIELKNLFTLSIRKK